MPAEAYLDFPVPRAQVPVCTGIRSTLVGSSVLALKKHGLYDRYIQHLPKEHHDTILYGVVGQWLPIEVGQAHYAACLAMGLSHEEMLRIGHDVAALAQKTMFSFVLRVATESGVTPWTMIGKGQAYWDRSYRGSSVAAFKIGPKECRVEIVANPLAANFYWRSSLQGILTALTQAFCRRAFVRELRWDARDPFVVMYRLSWV